MELTERDDLNEYYNNCRLNNDEIESQWKAKKDLQRDLQDNNVEHLKGFDKVHMQKKKVVEELFAVTWQLRQRDRELKQEQRTVESLLANKKKLSQIIEDLNAKIEQLNDKIEELQLNLHNVKEEKENIINKFKEFKLSQLKQKKFQLVQTKKFMQELQKEYMSYGHEVEQVIKQSNSDLQTFVVSIEANLKAFTTQHEDEMNQQRTRLDQQHQDILSAQLFQEKERSRVQLDAIKSSMGEQIVQLGEQLQILKKKLSHTGQNNSQLGIELDQSQNVMKFADQEIFDVRLRYKNIKGELDTIVSESKGKYEAIEQEHQSTTYGKQQVQQLKHFTDIQNAFSQLLLSLQEIMKKYFELDQQKERDLKNSQAILQTKILSSSRLMQSKQSPKKESTEVMYQLTDSFSPTQYAQRAQKEQPVIKEEDENKKLLKTQKI